MSLTPEQDVTLSLLRIAARPDCRAQEELGERVTAADPARLMDLLVRLRVLVALSGPLIKDPSVVLPAWFEEQVAGARLVARGHGLLQHALTRQLTEALEAQGVPVVPLKGTALAEAAHGDLGARQSSDLDLLVTPEAMDRAVAVVSELGWSEQEAAAPGDELPRLHRVLTHPSRPPVELHWRVHWYESAFAQQAIGRAAPAEDGTRRLAPADELACLLLFLARDGLAGLRLTADIAAWWSALGRQTDTGAEVRTIAQRHPEIAPALGAAARWAEKVAGLEAGSLLSAPDALSAAQRLALRLANPWLEGSHHQIDAEVSLIDGLLGPPGAAGAFLRRRLIPPAQEAISRDPGLREASKGRLFWARVAHVVRVLGRYVLATRRLARTAAASASPSARWESAQRT